MALPAFLGKIFSGGASTILDSAGKILDNVITNKEELAAAKLELEKEVNRHFETLETLALEQYKAEAGDRDSARKREVGVLSAGGKNLTQNLLAFVGVFGFFGIISYLLSRGLGDMSSEASFIIGNMTGMAGAIAKDIYSYYFGSSKSSHAKDKTISDFAKQ